MDESSEELADGLCDGHVGKVELEFELELLKRIYEIKAQKLMEDWGLGSL